MRNPSGDGIEPLDEPLLEYLIVQIGHRLPDAVQTAFYDDALGSIYNYSEGSLDTLVSAIMTHKIMISRLEYRLIVQVQKHLEVEDDYIAYFKEQGTSLDNLTHKVATDLTYRGEQP